MDFITLLILTTSMLSIAVLATLSSIKKESKQLKNSTITTNEVNTIKSGYAYTVDMGDSLLIVAVIDKNSSSGIMFAYKNPLEVKNVADRI